MLVATPEKRILFVSETYEGSASEKRIVDEAGLRFGPAGASEPVVVRSDLGFEGYGAEGAVLVRPHKKPRGGALSDEQKASNRAHAQERVVVEHAIGGVKIWRVVKEVCRSWLHERRDTLLVLGCGLHNFRLACRMRPIQP